MSNRDNPYGESASTAQAANISFGTQPSSPPGPEQVDLGLSSPAGGADLVKDTTTATFQADVIQESRNQPVLVDFWAPWCEPCKQLTPALESAVAQARGRVKLVKMNIDDHPAIAGQLGIQSIPAVIAFKDGQPVDGFMGAVPESQIRELIDKVAGGADPKDQIAEALEAARQTRENGDEQGAAQVYSAILQQDPANTDALGGLADIMFEAGQPDRAKQLLDQVPETKREAAPVAAVHAKLALAEQVAGLGDPAVLRQRLADDPKDHQARFDLAVIQSAQGQRMEAAENLLEIIRTDKAWNDGSARDQLLKFFEAWGPADEATQSARRRLSSMLFS